jgi:hypothetical protein
LDLEDVVFRHVRVKYSGGPVRLHNVSFVDCIFEMPLVKEARQLGEAVIVQGPVNLEVKG